MNLKNYENYNVHKKPTQVGDRRTVSFVYFCGLKSFMKVESSELQKKLGMITNLLRQIAVHAGTPKDFVSVEGGYLLITLTITL